MKISNEPQNINVTQEVFDMISDFQKKYRTVYWIFLDGDIYVYKPVGRKDYKEICSNETLEELDKEDEIIRRSLLYPDPKTFDIDTMIAGVAKRLFEEILKNSFLESVEIRTKVLQFYRQEMYDLQNQIPCIINEAFPQYDIEDIENWDIERTAKYLSRAEFKLQNFRGLKMNYDLINNQENNPSQQPAPQQEQMPQEEPAHKVKPKKGQKQKLTPEKLAQLKRDFPQIDWEHDSVTMEGIDGLKDSVKDVPVALRTPGI